MIALNHFKIRRTASAKTTIAFLLLGFLVFQCLYFACRTGQTTDETFYSGGGYPIVRYNNYEFLADHPPFLYQLSAFPLLFIQPKFPIENPLLVPGTDRIDCARNGALFLYKMGNDPDLILFLERLPLIILTTLLGLGIFLFGRDIYGEWGALLALFLYVFSPDIIANGSLFMTDMGVTALIFFSVFALKKFFDHPDLKRSILLGIVCGLTFMSKISGLILFPIVTFLFFIFFFSDQRARVIPPVSKTFDVGFGILSIFLLINAITQKQALVILGPVLFLSVFLCFEKSRFFSFNRFMQLILKALLVGGYVLAFVFSIKLKKKYGIETSILFIAWNVAAALFTAFFLRFWNKGAVTPLIKLFLATWLMAALVIVLGYTDFLYKFYRFVGFGNYVRPLGIVLSHSLGGHRSCLEGSFITCDWRYFFGILVIKTPLLILGLSILGFFLLLRSKLTVLTKAIIIAPIVLFLGVSILNKINVGLRHILPIFPFLFVLGGFLGAALAGMRRGFSKALLIAGLSILLLFFAVRTLRTAPNYLSYFNELIGGSEEGAKLIPINAGQDNKALAEFVLAKKIPFIRIASGSSNSDIYNYYQLNWASIKEEQLIDPLPGFYALDIGIYLNLQKQSHSWFRGRQPLFRVGDTICIFHVPSEQGLPQGESF